MARNFVADRDTDPLAVAINAEEQLASAVLNGIGRDLARQQHRNLDRFVVLAGEQ